MNSRRVCRAVLEALFPAGPCVLCGGDSRSGPAPGICGSCWRERRRPATPLCTVCGVPFPAGGAVGEGDLCGECLADPPAFVGHRSAYLYEGPVRELLLLYKDAHRYPLAGILGGAVARVVRRSWPGLRFDAVVPVPGGISRRLRRGFEPASLAAGRAARALGVPLSRSLRLRRAPRTQKGLTAVQRRENLRGAFLSVGVREGARLLLVDDVTTTGTTLREAAAVLAAGGAEVYATTVAMTPERALDMVGTEANS